jgi:ribosome-associated protein
MKEFELNGHEFIELNKLMKFLRFAGSGGEANQIIDDGEVIVNDVVETRRRKKLRTGDTILFQGNSILIK